MVIYSDFFVFVFVLSDHFVCRIIINTKSYLLHETARTPAAVQDTTAAADDSASGRLLRIKSGTPLGSRHQLVVFLPLATCTTRYFLLLFIPPPPPTN